MPEQQIVYPPYYERGYKGVWEVYRENGNPTEFYYTLDPHDDENDWPQGNQFDVRDLPQYDPEQAHVEVISAAVDAGDLVLTHDVLPNGTVEVTVVLTPEVEEGGDYIFVNEIASCARRAIENAMNHAVDEGLVHPRVDDLSFPKVEVIDPRT